jgi:hypothetical protein
MQVERRQLPRSGLRGEPPREEVTSLILGAYGEMPGLSLTLPQAARLFGLPETTCRVVLEDMVRERRLRRLLDGRYARV